MSREIKFRVWDKKDKRMIVHEQEFIPLKVTNWGVFRLDPTITNSRWQLLSNSRFDLMQFIGLKDKNGKKIYEDDIIEFENQGKYIIIYREDSAMFYVKPTTNGEQIPIWLEYSNNNCPYEVIGNIYENPELLEVT